MPITVWAASGTPRGLILFSHGAASAPWKYTPLLQPWAAAGFTIYAPLHVDSTDHPDHATFTAMQSWPTRLLDLRALSDFVHHAPYVAAGHSYGALVALTLGGATPAAPPGVAAPLRDRNARAVVAFSPPGPTPGLITSSGYATLAVPALIETGDKDIPALVPHGDWRVHLAAFDAAPGPDVYGLVLPGVDHYFGNIICRPDRPDAPQAPQFARAVAISTLFLRAYGGGDREALAALRKSPDLKLKS